MAGQHTSFFARSRALLLTVALAAGGLGAVGLTAQSASATAPDQLVVTDVTNGQSQELSSVSLQTVNVDGSQSFAKPVVLPTADAAGVNAFALSGNSNGNGALSLSANGNYLSVAGYHQTPTSPTGDPKGTTAAVIQRMVARVSSSAVVDTTTLIPSPGLSKSAPRAAASNDGSAFYVSGNGGSDSPNSGVIRVNLGGGGKVAIADTNQKNLRQVQIAGGSLYATTEKGALFGLGKIGTGLPAVASAASSLAVTTTNVGGTTPPQSDFIVPDAFVMLHTGVNSASSTVIDTAYVVIDTDTGNGISGEIRKYTSSNGTTWTKAATVVAGDYPFLTGRVNAAGTGVQLFATKGSGDTNSVVEIDDSTLTGVFTPGTESTVANAAAGHAFRGVALPPSGWNPGTVSHLSPTVSTTNSTVGATLGDSNNPTQEVDVADPDSDPSTLTLSATSSNTGVLPNGNIVFSGTGATRTVSMTPTGKGRATITITVKDPENNSGSTQLLYAASSAPTSATGHYFYESSDLSSAVDVGSGYTLAVSSEDSTLRLYDQSKSGRPVKTFDMGADAPNGIGNGGGDLEGMALVGTGPSKTLYVSGSEGNNSSGDPKPNRRVLFTATVTGSGASTAVTYVGEYTGLWDDLRNWDVGNGNPLKFAAGQADGVAANDPNGFNIEGFEFAPGSTSTAYLGFRSPLVTHNGTPDAVIVPVTNADSLIGASTGAAHFGSPIFLDLGGRTIRDIRKNSNNEYLITAQADPPINPQWKLYAWDGKVGDSPIAVKTLADPATTTTGSWESVVSVPHPLASGAIVSLITDSGDTEYYDSTTAATDEPNGEQKSYTDNFTLDSFTSFPSVPQNVSATPTTDGAFSVNWDAVSGAASYNVTVKDGANNISGSPKSVPAPTTSTTFSGLTSKLYTVTVTAVNASGESDPSSPAATVTPNDVIANVTKPAITGQTVTDQTLTVTPGTWTPAGVTLAYQWKADGTDISGATGTTLVLGAGQVGKSITVTEKASKGSSSPVSVTSTATAVVTAGQFTFNATPTISGSPQIGVVLSANGASALPVADNFSYQWFASDAPNTPIAGATTSTFTPTAAQVGKTITVQVVAHRAGYADGFSAKSNPTTAVDPLAVSNSVPPTITGSPAVDSVLTEHDGTWAPGGVAFTYEWLADGNVISGATGSTFTPTAAELGKKITVRVTGTKTNLSQYVAESIETAPVAAAPVVNQTAPVLSGTAREGQQLSTTDGTWTPGGTTYSYQWKADGTNISGAADASTYTLTSGEVGKVITVEVTASKSGYSDAKKTSNSVGPVDPTAVSNTTAPSITSAAVVGTPITVNTGTWKPSGVGFAYQWLADGSPIAANSTSATFTPTITEFGKKISVTVTGSKSGLTSFDKDSNETSAVTNAMVNNTAPVISGQAIEGKTLTTTDGTWTPTPTSFTYVWKSGGNILGGETTNHLVVPSGAAGSTITVEVTAAKDGYNSAVKASAPTGTVDPSAVTNLTLPSIPTAPIVGTQLTADHGTWNPGGVSYAYQWLANGGTIDNATSQTFTPTATESGEKLSVRVTASKSGLTSDTETSAETSAVTGLPPVFGAPTNLTVTGTTASTITVSWTKSTDATHYRLYQGIGTGTRTKLEVGNVSTATFTGLKPNTTYSIDISAFKADGTQSAYNRPRLDGSTAALTAPTDLSFSERAGTSITVTWTKVPGVKNYRITYGIGTGKRTTVNVGDVDNYNITGLKHGQAYSIDIASLALDKKTVSPASPRINPSTSALLPPTKLKVTGVTATTVTLTWTKAAGAASYRLYYGIGSGTRTRVVLGDVNTATVTGLTKGKKYSIDVASVEADGVGRSSYTTRVTATTK
ncbi:MAG: hypothetical protein JWQ70_266 [Aeromicrobium sp.]|nr:hypothetical protein [Aeromicrobium sp.]